MSAPEPLPAEEFQPCPHCGVRGHWAVYVREQLVLRRCPWSGLFLSRIEVAPDRHLFMCGVCDCFGYPPAEIEP